MEFTSFLILEHNLSFSNDTFTMDCKAQILSDTIVTFPGVLLATVSAVVIPSSSVVVVELLLEALMERDLDSW